MRGGYCFSEGIMGEDVSVLDPSEIERRLNPFWKKGILFSFLIRRNTCNMICLQLVFSLFNIMAKINEMQMPIFLKLRGEERRTGVRNLVAGEGGY